MTNKRLAQIDQRIAKIKTELAAIGPLTKFQTALEVNRTLGNLFTLVAQKRIYRHDGTLLGFIGQMLLNSVGSTVKSEMQRVESQQEPIWAPNVRRALASLMANPPDLSTPAGA